jgi:predicted naringenin-chalcone synthase
MSAYIQCISTAVPEYAFEQQQILSFMRKAHDLNETGAHQLSVLYRAGGIKQRHSVLPDFGMEKGGDFFNLHGNKQHPPDTRSRMQTYAQSGLPLAIAAIDSGDINMQEITHLIWVSCTGMQAPGLDAALIHHYKLNTPISRFALQFMGCFAALPALRMAKALCDSDPEARVLILSLELCTLHFQHEATPDNLLANSLFADGAAAVLVASTPGAQKLEIGATYSTLIREGEPDMAWNIGPFGFEMKLSHRIPQLLKAHFPQIRAALDTALGLKKDALWAIHPGGKAILEGLADVLGLERADYKASSEVLKRYGNMSSATLLFVLREMLDAAPAPGSQIATLAFGPGLSVEALALQYHA